MHDMDMDFPPLEDLAQQDFAPDFFGGLSLPSAEMLKTSLVASLAGGGGILITANLVEKLGSMAAGAENEMVQKLGTSEAKAAMSILLGIVGGQLMWADGNDSRSKMRQQAAMSVVSAVSGLGVAKMVALVVARVSPETNIAAALSAAEVSNVPPDQFFSQTRGPVGEGFDQVDVTDDSPLSLSDLHSPEVEVDAISLASYNF
jgi:hypothetical protein